MRRRRNSDYDDLPPMIYGGSVPAPSPPQQLAAPYFCVQCRRRVMPLDATGMLPAACDFCDEPVKPGAPGTSEPPPPFVAQQPLSIPMPGPIGTPIADLPAAMVEPDLRAYDYVIVAFSGGKDSLAALLTVIDTARRQGVNLAGKIELWHHDVDSPESGQFMDWPVTTAYVKALGKVLGIPVYFSWKTGGFLRELMRQDERTASAKWEEPGGRVGEAGGIAGPLGTRRRWPAVSADLATRYCSPSFKIEVMDKAIANQERFKDRRVLVITGERAEEAPVTETAFAKMIRGVIHAGTRGRKKGVPETKCGISFKGVPAEPSPFGWWYTVTCDECHKKLGRAGYNLFEAHRTHAPGKIARRHVDQWRSVHHWNTPQVWEIIRRYGIVPHPAYRAGFGRVSCAFCIFGSPNQWATLRDLMPTGFERIAQLEQELGHTINRDETIRERAARGLAYAILNNDIEEGRRLAVQPLYDAPIRVDSRNWVLPAGAYAEAAGPT